MRILIIEDNAKLAHDMRVSLQQAGYTVDVAATAEQGDEMAVVERCDAIVLDVLLGEHDGIELCRTLRRRHVAVPILMLTVLATTADKVRGLDAGADDYLTKPYELNELLARLRSLLRRSQATEGAVLRSGDLVLDLHQRRVRLGGAVIKMTAKELGLLEYMMRNPGKLLTRAMISESVWDMNYDLGSNVIDVYVSNLRRKIDRDTTDSRIETVIGSGYRFTEDTVAEHRAVEATGGS